MCCGWTYRDCEIEGPSLFQRRFDSHQGWVPCVDLKRRFLIRLTLNVMLGFRVGYDVQVQVFVGDGAGGVALGVGGGVLREGIRQWKSWEGVEGRGVERGTTRCARTWVTPSCCWTVPSISRNDSEAMRSRVRS